MGTWALHRKTNIFIHRSKLANADVAILDDRQPPNEYQVMGLQTTAERVSAKVPVVDAIRLSRVTARSSCGVGCSSCM